MSQSPYQDPGQYNPNLPYAMPGGGGPVSPRPGAVTGLAITGIVLACLGLFCNLLGMGVGMLMMGNGGKNPFAPTIPPTDHALVNYSLFSAAFQLVLSGILLGGSIAALKLKPAARKILLMWSVVMLLWVLTTTMVTITWAGPMQTESLKKLDPNNPVVTSGMGSTITIGSAVMGALFYSTLPVLFLILWNRPRVKAAFSGAIPMPPPQYPPV